MDTQNVELMETFIAANRYVEPSSYDSFIEGHLGSGSYGDVFLVEPKVEADGKLAAKLFKDGKGREPLKEAMNELDIANEAITHEHLLHVKYACTSFFGIDVTALLYEYCEKRDLSSTLRKEPEQFSELVVVKICGQITDAMIFLHNKNIMHRDLKLKNVMVRSIGDGNVNIAVGDFGFCKRTGNLVAKTNLGTISSKAPEVGTKMQYDGKVDSFGLGVILYELFSLRKPRLMQKMSFNINILGDIGRKELQEAVTRKRVNIDAFDALQLLPVWKWEDVQESAKNLILRLLSPTPDTRASFEEVEQSEWVTSTTHNTNPLHSSTDWDNCVDNEKNIY